MAEYPSGDRTLAYREIGSGPPRVLLHAFPLSSAMWEPQIGELGRNHRVLAPDFRGFGGSPVGVGPTRMAQFADDVVALLDHVGIERAAVVGLSMGGYVAFALWRRARARVAGMVLCDTRASADTDEARANREKTAARLKEGGIDLLVETMVPKLLAPDAPEAVRAGVASMIRGNDPRGAAAALRGMAIRTDSTDLLGSLAVPCLVVVGEKDALTPPDEARAMAGAIPGATLVTIPGAGHLSNLESPAEFNRAVGGFLASRGL